MYEAYKKTAEALNLRMTPRDPGVMTFFIDLDGELDGQSIHVRRVVGTNGFFVVECRWKRALGAGLMVTRAGLFDAIATRLGGQDIEIGEARFDEAFRVRAKDEARAREVLSPEVREALLACDGEATLTDESVSVRHPHAAESTDPLIACCHEMARIARLANAASYR